MKKSIIILNIALVLLSGCATHVNNKDFTTSTNMTETIFLDPVKASSRTIFVDMKNTSGIDNIDCSAEIQQSLRSKGYAVVDDPAAAHYMLQANVRSLDKQQGGVYQKVDNTGAFVGTLAGAGAGAAIGGATGGNPYGGALMGGLFGLAIGAMIDHSNQEEAQRLGLFQFTINLQISEKSDGVTEISGLSYKQGKGGSVGVNFNQQTDRKKYQTDLLVRTNAQMELKDAIELLKPQIAKSIAGIF